MSRIRHVKCDEGKPICARCSTQGYKCDGYQPFIQFAPKKSAAAKVQHPQRPCNETATQPDNNSKNRPRSLLACARSPSVQLSISSAENALLHHVRTCVVQDIAAAARPSDFWYDYVLPLAHSTAAIKHALCALGAAHRYFVSHHGDSAVVPSKTVFSLESMQCYNDAIAALNSLLSSESSAHWDVVLICCAIFITIENLNGRSAEAACHLRAGCGIIKRFGSRKTMAATAATELMNRGHVDGLLLALEDMLYCFGQYLAMYVGFDAFADLDFDIPVTNMGDPDAPFTSLKEAERMFQNIDHGFYIRMWKAKAYSPRPANITDMLVSRTESLESRGPSMDRVTRNAAKIAARADLVVWSKRFQPLARQNQDPRHIVALTLHHAVWSIIFKAHKLAEDFASVECQRVLDLAEVMISMDAAATTRPRFTFDGNLVWTLWYICFGSQDPAVQTRCVRLLHAANRREGVWDSRDVAAICETAVTALHGNTLSWEDVPHGILTLADMLQVRLQGFSLGSVRDIAVEAATGNG